MIKKFDSTPNSYYYDVRLSNGKVFSYVVDSYIDSNDIQELEENHITEILYPSHSLFDNKEATSWVLETFSAYDVLSNIKEFDSYFVSEKDFAHPVLAIFNNKHRDYAEYQMKAFLAYLEYYECEFETMEDLLSVYKNVGVDLDITTPEQASAYVIDYLEDIQRAYTYDDLLYVFKNAPWCMDENELNKFLKAVHENDYSEIIWYGYQLMAGFTYIDGVCVFDDIF